ncbi:hypothetical protein IWQ62_002609 [Dispira parvispora]|uniref:Secreted protein n=1 Tax=Dispira parvispora TaxID=1520584 RepID=A0A9W8E2H7_9FUNG|nr:hypothetical protein IWQ62_002609 [Dispira parvispora]
MHFTYLGTVATLIVAVVVSHANAKSCDSSEIRSLKSITRMGYKAYNAEVKHLNKYPNSNVTSSISYYSGEKIAYLQELCTDIQNEYQKCSYLRKALTLGSSECSKIMKIQYSTVQGQSLTPETADPANTSRNVSTDSSTGSTGV